MSEPEVATANCEIVNELGMHARAATKFVQLAARYPCDVKLEKDGQAVNGKSIMGVLMLVACKGTFVQVSAKGDKAAACVAALVELIAARFGEAK